MFGKKFISNDLILFIFSFLNNSDNSFFVSTCKYLNKLGSKHGYLTYLKCDANNLMKFLRLFCKHNKTIQKIKMENIDEPQNWLPNFVKNIEFLSCEPSDKYISFKGNKKRTKLKV